METNYWQTIFVTLLIVIGCGFLLVFLENMFRTIGLIGGMAAIIGGGIWLYKYLVEKDRCPLQKKNDK